MSNFTFRFAPSPTGNLHIGSVRTAIFNYLFAKHTKGRVLLRIEDTDQARSLPQYTDNILNSLRLLNIEFDGNIVYQSKSIERHVQVAHQLLQQGRAYKCYVRPEEIEEFRAQHPNLRFESPWRDKIAEDSDTPYVIRLRAEQAGVTTFHDLILGESTVNNEELDDMVLLRSDGTPTYMLAVVVDDLDMGITHVVRGSDHFTNTFRQLQLYRAIGQGEPQFMHLPLLCGEDGAKLSKRHGATSIEEFIAAGYLPEAMLNYLLLLGAGYDAQEIFDLAYAIEHFDYTRVSKSPSRFDYKKLNFINREHLRALEPEVILEYITTNLPQVQKHELTKMALGMKLIKERSELMPDILKVAKLFITRAEPLDAQSAEILAAITPTYRAQLKELIENCNFASLEAISLACKEFATTYGLKMPEVLKPLRALILGTFESPSITDMIYILGKEEVVRRIEL